MEHSDFEIGKEFTLSDERYLCTDKGTRTIAAIRVDQIKIYETHSCANRILNRQEAEAAGWFNGPPYAVKEHLFDENDQEICQPCH